MFLQTIVHYSLHILFPGIVSKVFFKKQWKIAWAIILGTMVVDLDHLLATPIFDPNRCSIGFHPLHSEIAIVVYIFLLVVPNFYIRVIGIGLLLHMLTDWQDCFWL